MFGFLYSCSVLEFCSVLPLLFVCVFFRKLKRVFVFLSF
nr:MAG TPA: hypothetical protein [Caudoviricetes sp.]